MAPSIKNDMSAYEGLLPFVLEYIITLYITLIGNESEREGNEVMITIIIIW